MTFPASVVAIDETAFVGNPGLVSVIFTGPAPTVTDRTSGNRTFPINNPEVEISYPWSQRGSYVIDPVSQPETWHDYVATAIRGEFTVSFDSNGHGSAPPADQIVLEGEQAAEPDPVDPDSDWVFTGWFTDASGATSFDSTDPITADTVVYAGWEMVEDPGTDDPDTDEPSDAPGDEADNETEAKDRTNRAADDVLPATGSAVDAAVLLTGLLLTLGGMFVLTRGRGRRTI